VTALGLVALLALAAGCQGVLPEPDLARMLQQRSYRSFEPAPMFADGRAMRPPPAGTISRDRDLDHPALTSGIVDRRYVDRLPLAADRPLLERGRDRFDVFCAACHGPRGDGVSPVAVRMRMRKPPSLIEAPVTAFPPGRLFQVISEGYGLMPAYSSELVERDRWAVVAYLRALALSQSVALDELPDELRARAERALP
jgi:mono/diheme cytochrome c family protein